MPHLPPLAAGDALLLTLLRLSHADREPVMAAAATWQAMLARATELAVSPLVFAALRAHAGEVNAPADVLATLHDHYAENGLRNLALYRTARLVLQHFQRQGIAAIVLKGVYLAQAVYRDPAARVMSDVDLLVKAEARGQVAALFGALGYSQVQSATDAPTHLHHDRYRRAGHSAEFEVHWALISRDDPFHIDLNGLWERAAGVSIAGVPVCVLAVEDTLLHLCVHMTYQHVFDRFSLRCLCDVQRAIRNYGERIDWDAVCARAAEWGCERNVHLALLAAHRLLGAAVPADVLRRLRPADFDERLVAWATHRVLGLVDDHQGPWSANLGRWQLATSVPDKAALLLRMCFPTPQELARRSGASHAPERVWLAYVRRWGDLLRRAGQAVLPAQPNVAGGAPVRWVERETGRTALVRWLRQTGEENAQQ
jgi:hypothetical protein